jgi:hypothetical protein
MALNNYSATLTQRRAQVGSQAMLYGIGLTDADMQKAQVGIVSMGWEGNPCNMAGMAPANDGGCYSRCTMECGSRAPALQPRAMLGV